MELSNVIIRVSNLETSIGFWRDRVGLHLAWSSGEFAFSPPTSVTPTVIWPASPAGWPSDLSRRIGRWGRDVRGVD